MTSPVRSFTTVLLGLRLHTLPGGVGALSGQPHGGPTQEHPGIHPQQGWDFQAVEDNIQRIMEARGLPSVSVAVAAGGDSRLPGGMDIRRR